MGVIRKAIAPQFQRGKWKVLRGDLVHITAGKDKGQQGVIAKVIRDDRIPRVIVEGRNLVRLLPSSGSNRSTHPCSTHGQDAPLRLEKLVLVSMAHAGSAMKRHHAGRR